MQKFTGLEYLKMDIAANYGLDKATWQQRLAWFEENQANLDGFLKDAKKPCMMRQGIIAYRNVLDGQKTGYTIGLDATWSGLQALSLVTGDEKAAQYCNVIQVEDKCIDGYTEMYKIFKQRAPDAQHIEREHIKQALMTALYSSTKVPRTVIGKKHLETFYEVASECAPYAWILNNLLCDGWNPNVSEYNWDMPDGFHVNCPVINMVDEKVNFGGVEVTFRHKSQGPREKGRFLPANVVHSVDSLVARELVGRCMYSFDKKEALAQVKNLNTKLSIFSPKTYTKTKESRYKNRVLLNLLNQFEKTGFFSIRFLDVITEDNYWLVPMDKVEQLVESLPDKPFDMLVIHDCFRVHPNYGNDVRDQYRKVLQELSNSTILDSILSSIFQKEIHGTKAKSIIVDGEYAIC